MEDKDYKRLNDYLNDVFIFLSNHDVFFYRNMSLIFKINYMLIADVKEMNLKHKFHENHNTFLDVFDYARKMIEKINSGYLSEFDRLICSGKLGFFESEENLLLKEYDDYDKLTAIENNEEETKKSSRCCYVKDECFLDLARKHDYSDVMVLVHEFMHSTSKVKNMGKNRYILAEFLSIYFEMFTQLELLKSGVNISELNIFYRIKATQQASISMYNYSLILRTFELFGSVSEKSTEELEKFRIALVSKEIFEAMCISLLKYFDKKREKYSCLNETFDIDNYRAYLSTLFRDNYRYILGTLLSCYVLEHGDKDKVVWLNDHINDEGIENINLISVLQMIDIDLTQRDIDEQLINCFKKYYEVLKTYVEKNAISLK